MASVTAANNVTGTITQVLQGTVNCTTPPVPNPCFPTSTVYQVTPPTLENFRFQNGRIRIGNKNFDVWFNDPGLITLKGMPSGSTNGISGKAFTVYDDDDYNADDTQKDGDANEAIVAFDDSFRHLQSDEGNYGDGTPRNVYASAYVSPTRDWAAGRAYNQSNITFDLNVAYTQANPAPISAVINQHRNSSAEERDDFWVSYLVFGYQGPLTDDFDGVQGSTAEDATGGVALQNGPSCDCLNSSTCPAGSPSPFACTGIPRGADGAIVFQEVIRDLVTYFLNPPSPLLPRNITDIATTTPHELTHQFGIRGDEDRATFMLMDYPDYTVGATIGPAVALHPEHINIIRSRVRSPGN
jgi:hypothetical protein